MSTRNKVLAAIAVAVILLGMPVYHTGQRFIHWVTEPDKTICVESHTTWVMQPYVISNGKSTTTTFHLVPIWFCDKEAPNPKYVEQMAKWRNHG